MKQAARIQRQMEEVQTQIAAKTVETTTERQKLVFRVKAQGDPEVLKRYGARVKTGLPGVATVRLDQSVLEAEQIVHASLRHSSGDLLAPIGVDQGVGDADLRSG